MRWDGGGNRVRAHPPAPTRSRSDQWAAITSPSTASPLHAATIQVAQFWLRKWLSSWLWSTGLRTSYVYDAASRLTAQQYQDGPAATFTYDANSRRTVLSDWTGRYTSSFDPDGRLTSVVNPAGIAITYNFDAVDQRATMLQPTGTFSYVYDPAGRISNLTNPAGQVTSWSYDAASRITQQLLANGLMVSNVYDNADRQLLLANLGSGGTTLSSFAYAYSPSGNRTQVIDVDGSVVTWAYDPTHQLTNERRSGTNGYNITYVYLCSGQPQLADFFEISGRRVAPSVGHIRLNAA